MTARTGAFRLVFRARLLSGLLFAATATGAALAYQHLGPAVAPALLVAAMAALLSPAGTLLSAWTLWAGLRVDSCPNCMDFTVCRFGPEYFECAECGEERAHLPPIASDRALVRGGESVCRDCADDLLMGRKQ